MQADKLRGIVAFLCGEAELDGRWYGDTDNVPLVAGKYPARYWWRSQLRKEADELLAIAEAAEDLRADAMRYRWLRNEAWTAVGIAPCTSMMDENGNRTRDIDGADLDVAIDAELAALSTVAPVREG